MGDKEKFEGFKKELIEKNEEKYGAEIREKYGDARFFHKKCIETTI